MEEVTLPELGVPINHERDDEELILFAETAMDEIREHLEHNQQEAYGLTDVEKTVDEVLSDDNMQSLDIRARPLENPRATLWLKDCPVWANDAWDGYTYPKDINAYNGKVHVVFDVRPF